MNKSLIWIAAGVAGIGFGIPAYAAMSSNNTSPTIAPATTVVSTPSVVSVPRSATLPSTPGTPATPASVVSVPVAMAPVVSTATAAEDTSGSCTEPAHATDDRCTGVAGPDVSSDSTATSVEDVSGSCDEPEHINDDRCTGTGGGTVTDDHSGQSNSGHGADDGTHHSGHGGSNDG
jgi:hypothetical protein